jgi:hypothetical protein
MREERSIVDILGKLEKNGHPDSFSQETIMTDKRQLVWTSLFWGSLWGLAEATLGHALHQIPMPGIAGYVMFPVGVFFMVTAFKHSGQSTAIFLTALVAANIKLIDLLLPSQSPFAVINPAVAILCESLSVGLFFRIKDFKKILSRFDYILGMAFVWRVFYGIGAYSLGSIFRVSNFLELGSTHMLSFFLFESAVNATLIYICHRIYKNFIPSMFVPLPASEEKESSYSHPLRKRPALLTIPLIVLAISVELFLL